MKRIGVAIIGLTPKRSWAATAHLPALERLHADYRLIGIANSSAASATAATNELGIGRAFASAADLVTDPAVDLVVITVKVPHHAELVRLAVKAGKHLYCEWPLGRTHAEARELAGLAASAGVVAAVGTQAVFAPAILDLARLCREGRLGDILSSTITGYGMTWGAEIEQRNAYLLDRHNGATMLTIAVGHMLSAVEMVMGQIARVSAALSFRRRFTIVRETGEHIVPSAPDQVMLTLWLADGTPLSLHYRGGAPRGDGLVWTIDGTAASARIVAPSGLVEMAPLTAQINDGGREGWVRRHRLSISPRWMASNASTRRSRRRSAARPRRCRISQMRSACTASSRR